MSANIFFTADTHFGHANILRYCKRPWLKDKDLDSEGRWISRDIAIDRCREMDDAIITNWNSVVKKKDIIYHLGDFCFGDANKYLARLNGTITFVLGNHDKGIRQILPSNSLPYKRIISINSQDIVLSHFAMRVWDLSHFNSWCLFAHSHNMLPAYGKSFDVGVDAWNYYPITFEQVKIKMDLQPDNYNLVKS